MNIQFDIKLTHLALHWHTETHLTDMMLLSQDMETGDSHFYLCCFWALVSHILNVESLVSGWGEASPTSSISDVLLEVELPIRKQMYCRETYGAIRINISDSQLCAGGIAGKDACQGASGGPLMMKNPKNERWFVAGIVSFGKGCGEQERPGVYTRITSHLNWIKENVLLI